MITAQYLHNADCLPAVHPFSIHASFGVAGKLEALPAVRGQIIIALERKLSASPLICTD